MEQSALPTWVWCSCGLYFLLIATCPLKTPHIPSSYSNEQTTKETKAISNSYIYIYISCKCDTNRAGHFTLDAHASRPVACWCILVRSTNSKCCHPVGKFEEKLAYSTFHKSTTCQIWINRMPSHKCLQFVFILTGKFESKYLKNDVCNELSHHQLKWMPW